MVDDALPSSIVGRHGHFVLESGHHGDLWLDLELLCFQPEHVERAAKALARQISHHDVEAVCGPLNEGAFLALMVALQLQAEFVYAERQLTTASDLSAVCYCIPRMLRPRVQGKRIAIVDDVINAGSAARSTYADLLACAAQPVAIAALVVLGDAAVSFAQQHTIPLLSLEQRPNQVWVPSECPLCAAGIPITTRLIFRTPQRG